MSSVSGVNKSGRGSARVQVRAIVGYGGPAILVAVLIGVMIPFQTNAEIAMSGFAQSLPIGFAAAAGMVATVAPETAGHRMWKTSIPSCYWISLNPTIRTTI